MSIEITPSQVLRSADGVADAGRALLAGEAPDDPGNPGFRTSEALRRWRDEMQRVSEARARATHRTADKLEASAQLLLRAEEANAAAAETLHQSIAA